MQNFIFCAVVSGFKYDRVLDMSWIAIDTRFRVYHVSANASVAKGCEYTWIYLNNSSLAGFWICLVNLSQRFRYLSGSKYARAQNMTRLSICNGYTGCWISLNRSGYTLIMSQYVWICLNNAEYDLIYQHIPEKTEYRICQNPECVCCFR